MSFTGSVRQVLGSPPAGPATAFVAVVISRPVLPLVAITRSTGIERTVEKLYHHTREAHEKQKIARDHRRGRSDRNGMF
jgi:hypothetical protein